MEQPRLKFWFDFASTYSYFSVMRIQDLAHRANVRVSWEPFLLGPIFAAQGWTDSPFNIYPAKGRYMWRDLERRSAVLNLPFRRPNIFPQNSLLAARVACAARDDPRLPEFCKAVFTAHFAQGGDISDPDLLARCLAQAGFDRDMLDRSADPSVKQALRAQGDAARDLDLFGAPSFTVGTELFWGDDRLEDALRFATQGE